MSMHYSEIQQRSKETHDLDIEGCVCILCYQDQHGKQEFLRR